MMDAVHAAPPAAASSSRTPLLVVALILLGLAAYVNTIPNRALFHHVPNAYADPVLDNTMLRSLPLLPRVFTDDFLLATNGRYRPLGYALFALANTVAPADSYAFWHVHTLALHLLGSIIVLALLLMLLDTPTAVGLAAVYTVHPLTVPLLNDVNTVYFLWGLLFSVLSLWLCLLRLRRRSTAWLVLSVLSFAAALLTYDHALLLPAFLTALCLFHADHPRGTAALMVVCALSSLLAGLFGVSVWLTLLALFVFLLIAALAARVDRARYLSVAKLLAPYALVLVLVLLLAERMVPRPVFRVALKELAEGRLTEPFDPSFIARGMLRTFRPPWLVLVVSLALPLAFLLRPRARTGALTCAVVLLATVTVAWNTAYRDDVTYWERMSRQHRNHPAVDVNLAQAYVAADRFEQGRELLLALRYENNVQGLLLDTVNTRLAQAYAGLGQDKLAGFYFFPRGTWWRAKIMKNLISESAHFCFRLGYLSVAEHFWACSLVIDPYDARLYNNLGRALLYKNFFRAAERYFRHALRLEPGNETALYYLAFLAQQSGDQPAYEDWRAQWRHAAHSEGEPDFRPVFDGFSFDAEKAREWFSGRPLTLLMKPDAVRIILDGKEYVFWEVPMEVGRYFLKRGLYEQAEAELIVAHELAPDSKEVMELLGQLYRKLRRTSDAERFERLARGYIQ